MGGMEEQYKGYILKGRKGLGMEKKEVMEKMNKCTNDERKGGIYGRKIKEKVRTDDERNGEGTRIQERR